MLQGHKKINFFDMIIDLTFIAFFAAVYLLPSININFIIPLALALAYCFYLGIKDLRLGANLLLVVGAIAFLAFAYTILADTKTISSSAEDSVLKQVLSKFNQYIMMFFPLLLSYRIIKTYSRKVIFVILICISAVLLYVLINTYLYLLLNPGAVRHWDDFSDLAAEGIASYDFVYAVPIIIGALAVCNKKFNLIGKLLNVVTIGFLFVFLIEAEYTLALLIAILSLVLVVYSRCKKITSKLLFFLACIVGVFLLPIILKLMYTYLPKGDISLRIKEIYNFIASGDTSGYNLSGRLSLYGKALQAFIDSPLIGNRELDFNGHGTFLIILADTGIMCSIPFFGIIVAMRKYLKNILGGNNKNFMPVFVAFIFMGIVNPIHATDALSFSMWCAAPLLIYYFYSKEEKNNEAPVED